MHFISSRKIPNEGEENIKFFQKQIFRFCLLIYFKIIGQQRENER